MKFLNKLNLSFKLILLFLLTGIAIAFVLRFSIGNNFKKHFQDSLNPHLFQYFYYINSEIGSPPDLDVAQQLSDTLKIKIILKGPGLNWSSDGNFVPLPKNHFKTYSHQNRQYESRTYRGRFIFRIANPPYQSTFITQHDRKFPSLWKLLINTLLGLLFVLGLLYLVLHWMISPLKHIQAGITRIGSGELDHRISITRQDELGSLAMQINAMAEEIENMLQAKQQLLLAISHELRSPITRAKVALSLMEEGQLKEGLESDIEEMERLVNELLEAERLNHRHQEIHLSKTTMNQLVTDVITQSYLNEPIQQKLDPNMAIQSLDEARFRFVIKNLLSNALKYRKHPGDPVIISTQQADKQVFLVVEDQGYGIPENHIPHLTEPFYRVDSSRQRETGGYGLGLYIIKMIVEAHSGDLVIESTEKVGTKIIIKLPREIAIPD